MAIDERRQVPMDSVTAIDFRDFLIAAQTRNLYPCDFYTPYDPIPEPVSADRHPLETSMGIVFQQEMTKEELRERCPDRSSTAAGLRKIQYETAMAVQFRRFCELSMVPPEPASPEGAD